LFLSVFFLLLFALPAAARMDTEPLTHPVRQMLPLWCFGVWWGTRGFAIA